MLKKAGVKRVIDTRLNNISQLAGFAKRADLEYFLKTIAYYYTNFRSLLREIINKCRLG